MQHLAITAAATAIFIGAGSGAVTSMTSAPQSVPVEVSNPMIAGAAMRANASIYDNVSKSPEHNTFVAETKAAGMTDTLKSAGSYTVFAPTDAAYVAQGSGKTAAMMKDAHKNARYLIVKGRYDSTTLLRLINEAGGDVKLHTLEGGVIVASLNGPTNISLMDENGTIADVSIYDINQSNGVMQVIDRVLAPGEGARQLAAR